MAPYSGPTRLPGTSNDRADPAFGRTSPQQPSRRAALLSAASADLEPAAIRGQPRFAEPRLPTLDAARRHDDLRAGERATVSSTLTDETDGGGMLRTAVLVAAGALVLVGIIAVLHMMGLRVPF
jgi:hypothetical protein